MKCSDGERYISAGFLLTWFQRVAVGRRNVPLVPSWRRGRGGLISTGAFSFHHGWHERHSELALKMRSWIWKTHVATQDLARIKYKTAPRVTWNRWESGLAAAARPLGAPTGFQRACPEGKRLVRGLPRPPPRWAPSHISRSAAG